MEDVVMVLCGFEGKLRSTFHKGYWKENKNEISNFRKTPLNLLSKTPLNPILKIECGGGGGGGGGGECQRIKVWRSRVYPLGQLPTIKTSIVELINEPFEMKSSLESEPLISNH